MKWTPESKQLAELSLFVFLGIVCLHNLVVSIIGFVNTLSSMAKLLYIGGGLFSFLALIFLLIYLHGKVEEILFLKKNKKKK